MGLSRHLLSLLILLLLIKDSTTSFVNNVAVASKKKTPCSSSSSFGRKAISNYDDDDRKASSSSLMVGVNMYGNNYDDDMQQQQQQQTKLPKLIVFDLDGCLWYPEMYQLYNDNGPPFRSSNSVSTPISTTTTNNNMYDNILLTQKGTEIKLLGDVRKVFIDLYCNPKYQNCQVGISSRTDQPDWARELLTKFQITIDDNKNINNNNQQQQRDYFVLQDVFDNNNHGGNDDDDDGSGNNNKKPIIEISYDSKVKHFERMSKTLGIEYSNMIFFDNEYWNCQEVSNLGVTVGYCPYGVTLEIWDAVLNAFPSSVGGAVVEL